MTTTTISALTGKTAVSTDELEVQATGGGASNKVTAASLGLLATPAIGAVTGLGTGVATFLGTPSSANLAAALTDETGTGASVFANTPTLVTPVLGAATATSINKVAFTAPATGSTLVIADGKTFTVSNTITFSGTDSVTANVSNGKLAQVDGSIDGGGLAIAVNSQTMYAPCVFAGTITALTIAVDTGTCTIKTCRKATGTAVPTISDSISTSGIAISTGTLLRTTSLGDFTSVTVTANDVFIFVATAVSGPTKIKVTMEVTKT